MNVHSSAAASLFALALAAPNASPAPSPVASTVPALSAAALASDEAVLRTYPTTMDARSIRSPRCGAADASEGELAMTVVDVSARVPFPGVDKQQRYNGRALFTITHVTVRVPRSLEWPGMTARDRVSVESMLAALRHHEVGHIRVAASEVARLNALPLTVTPDAEIYRQTVTRRADDGLAAVARAQAEYDQLTDHGRRQDRASGVLAGPPTELICGAAPRPPRAHGPDPYVPSPAPTQ